MDTAVLPMLTPRQWMHARGLGPRIAAVLAIEGKDDWAGGLLTAELESSNSMLDAEERQALVAMAMMNDSLPDDSVWKITRGRVDEMKFAMNDLRDLASTQALPVARHETLCTVTALAHLVKILESMLPPQAIG